MQRETEVHITTKTETESSVMMAGAGAREGAAAEARMTGVMAVRTPRDIETRKERGTAAGAMTGAGTIRIMREAVVGSRTAAETLGNGGSTAGVGMRRETGMVAGGAARKSIVTEEVRGGGGEMAGSTRGTGGSTAGTRGRGVVTGAQRRKGGRTRSSSRILQSSYQGTAA